MKEKDMLSSTAASLEDKIQLGKKVCQFNLELSRVRELSRISSFMLTRLSDKHVLNKIRAYLTRS